MSNDFIYLSSSLNDEDFEELFDRQLKSKSSISNSVDALEKVRKELNEAAKTRFVSLYEIHSQLGLVKPFMTEAESFYLHNNGWGGSEPGLHQATMRDLHPDHCPCCGRSWDD